MKTKQVLDFNVDKENKEIVIRREFDAPVHTVWRAWTESSILDQWWAPKPWKAQTKSMDFRIGGSWLYAMVGPDGKEQFGRADYHAIALAKNFSLTDAFTDEKGNIDTAMPQSTWNVTFKEKNDSTLVTVQITNEKAEDFDKLLKTGFQEGMTAALENLDDLISDKAI